MTCVINIHSPQNNKRYILSRDILSRALLYSARACRKKSAPDKLADAESFILFLAYDFCR